MFPGLDAMASNFANFQLMSGAFFDTVVVGAGMAGVTAAVQLAKAGHKVAILEVNSYIGGRMKSVPITLSTGQQIYFEVGANWIHGSCNEHPITKLAKQFKDVVLKESLDDEVEYYDEKGEEVDKKADKAEQLFNKLLDKCEDWQPQYSMEHAFREEGGEEVLKNKFLMFHVSNDTEFQTSGTINNIAASTFDDEQYDGKEMVVMSGYQHFVEKLLDKYTDQIQVFLNEKVVAVVQVGEDKNQIVCQKGTKVYAENVVIAVPIGVLKANTIHFQPPLPDWKQEAIQSIGFGNVCKILIEYQSKKLFKIKSHYIGVISDNVDESGLATYYLNLQALADVPCMMTFGLGKSADVAERMPQNELKNLIARRMSAFAEEKISPGDIRIYRSSWKGNENVRGAYTYASTTTRPKHWFNMAKPIFDSNWYFCGEHTSFKYRSAVHGAYLSGIYAAQFIIEERTEQNWKHPDQKKGK